MKQMKRLLPVLALMLMLLAVLAVTTLGAEPEPYAVFSAAGGSLTFCVGTKTDAGVVRADGSVVTAAASRCRAATTANTAAKSKAARSAG